MESELFRVTDGKVRLYPHPGQAATWSMDRRFVFMLAGTQGGKTSFGPWWLLREIQRMGGGDYLAVSSTYDLFNLKMLPEILKVYVGVLRIGRHWPGQGVIELCDPQTHRFYAKRSTDPMWGRIIMRSASSEGGLESATAKAAWLDEVGQDSFTLGAWEAVLRRLSLSQGRVLGTTTLYGVGWLKQQIYDRWLAGDRDIGVVQFASVQNPLFPSAEFERAKATLPAWKFAMFYLGQFAHPPGLIYDMYNEAVHMIPAFTIPPSWPRYVGIDPGAVNEWAIWVAEDPAKEVYYVYRETPLGNMTMMDKAELLRELSAAENVVSWHGGAGGEVQYRTDMNGLGIPVAVPPISDVEAGIDRVGALLKTKRLFVFDRLSGLRDELGTYRRKLHPQTQEPSDEIMNKSDYHRLDALRYACSCLSDRVDWSNLAGPDVANLWADIQPTSGWR